MSITSETQRKYDPNKGGFSYYTLFHADKGERPSWAQDGDMLEEFGEGGKAYVCSRDAKGRIKWTEKADWDRQTGGGSSGGGGGSLPADFPAEGIANANKFLGFDNSGDYAALDAPSGGAEKFVVTLTQDEQTEEWTADKKTVAEIVAAYEANKIVVAEISSNDLLVDVPCLSANVIDEDGTQFSYAVFAGNLIGDSDDAPIANINGFESDGSDRWEVSTKNLATTKNLAKTIPNGSNEGDLLVWDDDHDKWKAQSNPNAPLIVTMTDGDNPGDIVGDKTFGEIATAHAAGKNIVCVYEVTGETPMTHSFTVLRCGDINGTIAVAIAETTSLKVVQGNSSDYFGISAS